MDSKVIFEIIKAFKKIVVQNFSCYNISWILHFLEQIGTQRSRKLILFSHLPVQSWLTPLQPKRSPTIILTYKSVCHVLGSLPSSLSFHLLDPVLKSPKHFHESSLVPLTFEFLLHWFLTDRVCVATQPRCVFMTAFCKLRKGLPFFFFFCPPSPNKLNMFSGKRFKSLYFFLHTYSLQAFTCQTFLDQFKCNG